MLIGKMKGDMRRHMIGRHRMRALWTLFGGLLLVALFLIFMLGMFWVVDLIPLLMFIGVGVVYGVISSRKPKSSPSITD